VGGELHLKRLLDGFPFGPYRSQLNAVLYETQIDTHRTSVRNGSYTTQNVDLARGLSLTLSVKFIFNQQKGRQLISPRNEVSLLQSGIEFVPTQCSI
jgi:hypothetical protein